MTFEESPFRGISAYLLLGIQPQANQQHVFSGPRTSSFRLPKKLPTSPPSPREPVRVQQKALVLWLSDLCQPEALPSEGVFIGNSCI